MNGSPGLLNESLLTTMAPVLSAIWRRRASPEPTAPAGGCANSWLLTAAFASSRSLSWTLWRNVASTTTITFSVEKRALI